MESVLLWKEEPVSPLSNEEVILLDETFYHSPLDDVKLEDDLALCESKAEVASHILENLENLMDLDDLIKDEPYLLDEKILPLLDEVEPPRGAIAVPVSIKQEYYKQTASSYIINDIQSVYIDLNNGTPLTPPQSPPIEHPLLTNLEPLVTSHFFQSPPQQQISKHSAIYSVPEKQPSPPNGLAYSVAPQPINIAQQPINIAQQPINIPPPPVEYNQTDIAHELAVVDELIRTRVEDMQWNSGPSSPDSSSNSNFGDCSSSSEDPEWTPEPVDGCGVASSPSKVGRKMTKAHSGNLTDKKFRKKEQNKNAATRYRMKKKAEVEVILNEEKALLGHNNELNEKITDIQREIKYLKGLMRDLLKAKGVIN